MRYADYLRLEGTCSIVLGLVLAAVALPGLEAEQLWGLVLVPLTLVLLALIGMRAGASPWRPGEWLTTRPLASMRDAAPLDGRALTRRLVLETVVWIVAVVAWVLITGESRGLVLGTGLASALFGAVQAGPARARVEREAPDALVAERPGLGTPRLTATA